MPTVIEPASTSPFVYVLFGLSGMVLILTLISFRSPSNNKYIFPCALFILICQLICLVKAAGG